MRGKTIDIFAALAALAFLVIVLFSIAGCSPSALAAHRRGASIAALVASTGATVIEEHCPADVVTDECTRLRAAQIGAVAAVDTWSGAVGAISKAEDGGDAIDVLAEVGRAALTAASGVVDIVALLVPVPGWVHAALRFLAGLLEGV